MRSDGVGDGWRSRGDVSEMVGAETRCDCRGVLHFHCLNGTVLTADWSHERCSVDFVERSGEEGDRQKDFYLGCGDEGWVKMLCGDETRRDVEETRLRSCAPPQDCVQVVLRTHSEQSQSWEPQCHQIAPIL